MADSPFSRLWQRLRQWVRQWLRGASDGDLAKSLIAVGAVAVVLAVIYLTTKR